MTATPPELDRDADDVPLGPARPRRWPSRLAAVGTGLLLAASLPPWGFWPLAVPGIAVLDHLLADRPARSRFGRGWLVGLGLLGPTLSWLTDMTAPGAAIAIAYYSAVVGLAAVACPPGRWRHLALPGAWLLAEAFRSSFPFGGVPISLLAIGQVGGPLAAVARVGGVLLLGAITVALGVALSAAVGRRWVSVAGAVATVAVVLVWAAIAPRGSDTGQVRSAAYVQGGGPQGTRASETDERVVFERHLRASEDVPPGLDLTLWPEDVVDVEGPIEDSREGAELASLARQLDTTLIAGVVETVDDENFRNSSVVWDSEGEIVDRYEKVHRVPFGEWVPFRGLLEPIAGDALPQRDAVIGQGEATLDTPAGKLAVVISWEVFFGHRVRDGVEHGGQLVINPTNGASFRGTLVQTQQVASSRLRAIESGRWVVQIAPTGFSAFVTPDGEVQQRSEQVEPAVAWQDVRLRTGLTPYTRLGDRPYVVLGLALVAAAWVLTRRDDRRAAAATDGGGSDLQQHGDGAVVHQGDGHVGPEAPGGDRHPEVT